jgi:hypothetical protein
MNKRKATTPATRAVRRSKRSKTTTNAFVWNPREWKEKKMMNNDITLLERISDRKQKIFKEVVRLKTDRQNPTEIDALARLPDCHRVVKPIHYSASDPDDQHGTTIFAPYQLGDLLQWREAEFEAKNWKAVPESYI